jgi:hypothetical protein
MRIANSEFENAELSYRRGYQQGAYDALQLALAGADSDEIKRWVDVEIHEWRLAGMMERCKFGRLKRIPPPRRRKRGKR